MDTVSTNQTQKSVLQNISFRWMWLSGFISMIGDQFSLVAIPWITLQISGSATDLGIVLAIAAFPRALFMIFGGAWVDMYSPKKILLVSKILSAIVLAVLAQSIWGQWLNVNALYLLTFVFGFASAIAIPAGTSFLPLVVEKSQLNTANSLQMSTRQVCLFVGPILAGFVIALNGSADDSEKFSVSQDYSLLYGIAIAFAINVVTYIITAFLVAYKIKLKDVEKPEVEESAGVFRKTIAGIRYVANDKELKALISYLLLTSIVATGTIQVCIPVMADMNKEYGANLLGIMYAFSALGALIGMVIAGIRPYFAIVSLGITVVVIDVFVGISFVGFAFVFSSVIAALSILFALGIVSGVIQVKTYSWIQAQVDEAFLGRVMSIFTFAVIGLGAVSATIIGWILDHYGLKDYFIWAGISLAVFALFGVSLFDMVNVGKKQANTEDLEADNMETDKKKRGKAAADELLSSEELEPQTPLADENGVVDPALAEAEQVADRVCNEES